MKPKTKVAIEKVKEFEKESIYEFDKTVIIVDSVFRQGDAGTINDILRRLICAEVDGL